MNILNIEIYSLLIIAVLLIDYFMRFKRELNNNSWLYFILVFSVALLSIINIFLYETYETSTLGYLVFSLGYILLGLPSIALAIYIQVNLYEKYHLIKRYLLYGIIYMQAYTIFIFIYFINVIDSIDFSITHIAGLYAHNKILLLSLIPLLLVVIESIYLSLSKRINFNFRIVLSFFIPLIGMLLDINFAEITFIVPAYVLSILLVYLYRNDIVLNIDPLTGIFNRRKLSDGSFDKRKSKKYLTAAYIIDIDDFKFFNDTYGHNEGDIVLKEVSSVIKQSIRKTDFPIRLGGDEFLIVAMIDDKKNIKIIANNIKEKLKEYNKDTNKKEITVSIGYDIYDGEQIFDDFINNIDNKMYMEKELKKKKKKI